MMEIQSTSTENIASIKIEDSSSEAGPSRLGLCEVCAFRESKYTCPRCEVKTCSLRCNKIHKLEVECNGERDRTKYIPLKKFTNFDLSSDYRLLEEISRTIQTSRKKFGGRFKRDFPFSLIQLRNGAAARKTIIKFLPREFKRHKNNTTKFDFKENIIYWHVEWVFVNGDNLKMSDSQVSENEKLSSVLNKYLEPQEDSVLQERLQFYQGVSFSQIRLLLKAENKKGKRFYDLDPSSSLKECLQNKVVIEHPIIYIVLNDHCDGFNIVDSDCEDDENLEAEIKTGTQVVNEIIKHAESNESLYSSLKNLLFTSECSDEEMSATEN